MHPGGYGGITGGIDPDSGMPYFARDGILCDCVGVPGLDEVLCYAWRGDNYGPGDANETSVDFQVQSIGWIAPWLDRVKMRRDCECARVSSLAMKNPLCCCYCCCRCSVAPCLPQLFQEKFPNAKVLASTLDDFFAIVAQPVWRKTLPVITSEIGDTWIYGAAR